MTGKPAALLVLRNQWPDGAQDGPHIASRKRRTPVNFSIAFAVVHLDIATLVCSTFRSDFSVLK